MKNAEKQRAALAELDDVAVADYLLSNPDFFTRNSHLVERMQIPHPVRNAVSLVEWYMARARHRITSLEDTISQSMVQANANQTLFSSLLKLQSRLSAADSLQDLLNRLNRWARDLGLSGASVRLFPDRWHIGAPSNITHLSLNRTAFEPLRIQRLRDEHHYLGPLHGPELLVMLPQAKAVGSVAMSLMGTYGDVGVLMFTSGDPLHYQSGQGTQLLQELAIMLPELLERWIERR